MTKIRLISDPILRKRCESVAADELLQLQSLLDEMNIVMEEEDGVGIAANQIGVSKQIFIIRTETGYDAFVNPEIITQEELVDFENEACLSIPGVYATTKRFKKIRLSWLDTTGTKREDDFTDIKAFAIQHEMDHLNGKLYI